MYGRDDTVVLVDNLGWLSKLIMLSFVLPLSHEARFWSNASHFIWESASKMKQYEQRVISFRFR